LKSAVLTGNDEPEGPVVDLRDELPAGRPGEHPMAQARRIPVFQRRDLRERTGVFRDRRDAGRVLAEMLGELRGSGALLLGIPAGGVAVAAAAAELLALELNVAVVSKVTPPWNTEWGFGAVAFDGSTVMNESILPALGMDNEAVQACIERTRQKVEGRVALLCGGRPPAPDGRQVILIDDGLATGITMQAAVEALRRAAAAEIVVAVPTAHDDSIRRLAARGHVDAIYCANVRTGPQFAVASAYRRWHDLTTEDVMDILEASRRPGR
jgi:predicted phosphoribosyltransferase